MDIDDLWASCKEEAIEDLDNRLLAENERLKKEVEDWKESSKGWRDRADNWFLINWINYNYGLKEMSRCLNELISQRKG